MEVHQRRQTMDPDQIGQHFIVDFDGPAVTPQVERLVREGRIGGVILFAKNVRSPDQVRRLCADLQALVRDAGLPPMFISVDQEGGLVNRLVDGFTVFPSAMALGASGREDDVIAAARITAGELRSVGINTNHAPVLDVNTDPTNPVIGVRAFGEDPEAVGRLGSAYLRAAQAAGVLPTVKHFPGHGATSVDSHLDLPIVDKDRATLDREELVPYAAALRAGAKAVMAAHIVFPALDPSRPVTLSPAPINGLLRGELGFDGVVFTDSMAMKAIADRWSRRESAVASLLSGFDLVLACGTESEQWESINGARQAAADGTLTTADLRASAERIRRIKSSYAVVATGGEVGTAEHLRIAEEIAGRAVTLVKCARGRIPMAPGRTAVVNMTSQWREAAGAFAGLLRERGADVTLIDAADRITEDQWGSVVAVTLSWRTAPAAEQVRRLHARFGDRLLVIGLGNPYELAGFPEVSTYLATYGPDPASLHAAAKVLTGALEPTGRLPVTIPGLFPRGHRAVL